MKGHSPQDVGRPPGGLSERRIGHLKRLTIMIIRLYNVKLNYWCFAMKWVCDVINHTSMKSKGYNIPSEMFKG